MKLTAEERLELENLVRDSLYDGEGPFVPERFKALVAWIEARMDEAYG